MLSKKKPARKTRVTFNSLSYDELSVVLLFIHTKDVFKLRLVCKDMNIAIQNPYSWATRTLSIFYPKMLSSQRETEYSKLEKIMGRFSRTIQPPKFAKLRLFHDFLFDEYALKRLREVKFDRLIVENENDVDNVRALIEDVKIESLTIACFVIKFWKEGAKLKVNNLREVKLEFPKLKTSTRDEQYPYRTTSQIYFPKSNTTSFLNVYVREAPKLSLFDVHIESDEVMNNLFNLWSHSHLETLIVRKSDQDFLFGHAHFRLLKLEIHRRVGVLNLRSIVSKSPKLEKLYVDGVDYPRERSLCMHIPNVLKEISMRYGDMNRFQKYISTEKVRSICLRWAPSGGRFGGSGGGFPCEVFNAANVTQLEKLVFVGPDHRTGWEMILNSDIKYISFYHSRSLVDLTVEKFNCCGFYDIILKFNNIQSLKLIGANKYYSRYAPNANNRTDILFEKLAKLKSLHLENVGGIWSGIIKNSVRKFATEKKRNLLLTNFVFSDEDVRKTENLRSLEYTLSCIVQCFRGLRRLQFNIGKIKSVESLKSVIHRLSEYHHENLSKLVLCENEEVDFCWRVSLYASEVQRVLHLIPVTYLSGLNYDIDAAVECDFDTYLQFLRLEYQFVDVVNADTQLDKSSNIKEFVSHLKGKLHVIKRKEGVEGENYKRIHRCLSSHQKFLLKYKE